MLKLLNSLHYSEVNSKLIVLGPDFTVSVNVDSELYLAGITAGAVYFCRSWGERLSGSTPSGNVGVAPSPTMIVTLCSPGIAPMFSPE